MYVEQRHDSPGALAAAAVRAACFVVMLGCGGGGAAVEGMNVTDVDDRDDAPEPVPVVALGDDASWYCSGVVVSSTELVTAAHCVWRTPPAPTPTRVMIGVEPAHPPRIVRLNAIGNRGGTGNIALLTIRNGEPAFEAPYALLARPCHAAEFPGADVDLVGYGRVRYATSTHVPIRRRRVAHVARLDCAASPAGDTCFGDTEFAVPPSPTSLSVCTADSGGGAFFDGIVYGIAERRFNYQSRDCHWGGAFTSTWTARGLPSSIFARCPNEIPSNL